VVAVGVVVAVVVVVVVGVVVAVAVAVWIGSNEDVQDRRLYSAIYRGER
jgi:type II secretory pathway pseudopilin PulG